MFAPPGTEYNFRYKHFCFTLWVCKRQRSTNNSLIHTELDKETRTHFFLIHSKTVRHIFRALNFHILFNNKWSRKLLHIIPLTPFLRLTPSYFTCDITGNIRFLARTTFMYAHFVRLNIEIDGGGREFWDKIVSKYVFSIECEMRSIDVEKYIVFHNFITITNIHTLNVAFTHRRMLYVPLALH